MSQQPRTCFLTEIHPHNHPSIYGACDGPSSPSLICRVATANLLDHLIRRPSQLPVSITVQSLTTPPSPMPKALQPIPVADLLTYQWRVKLNGRRSLNGPRHGIILTGSIEGVDEPEDLYTVAHEILEHAAQQTAEMEYPDSIQLTLTPHPEPT